MMILRMSADIEISVDVNQSADKVFSYFTDWPRQGEWMVGTRVEARAAGDLGMGRGVNAEIAGFSGIGPIGFWDTMTVTNWIEGERVDVLHTGWLVRGTGSMIVVKVSEQQCRFVWTEQLDLPFGVVGRWGFAVLRPLFVAGVRHSLRKFAVRAESL